MKFNIPCRTWHRSLSVLILACWVGCNATVPPGNPGTEDKLSEQPAIENFSQNPASETGVAVAPAAQPVATQPAEPQPTPMRLTDDAFRFAAYEGKVELLREGLAAGNYVNAPDPQKQLTPLHMAAYNGHSEAIKLLLEHGATIDARDIEGKTALLHACTGPFPETVKILLDAGADINATETTEAFTPLMMAAGLGQTAVVKILLERKANKALMDNDGDTALKHAQNSRHAEIVQLLQE